MKKSYIYIVVTLITSYILGWVLFSGTDPSENLMGAMGTVIYGMMPAIIALIMAKLSGYKLRDLHFRKMSIKGVFISAIIPIIYVGILIAVLLISSKGGFKEEMNLLTLFPGLILAAVISIPIYLGEEIGWRGFLQDKLVRSLGFDKGIILLGLIWGIWHLPAALQNYNSLDNPIFEAFVYYPIFCICSSYIYFYLTEKYKSIWAPVIIHSFNNNVAAAIILLGINIEDKMFYAISFLVIMVITGLIFRRMCIKEINTQVSIDNSN